VLASVAVAMGWGVSRTRMIGTPASRSGRSVMRRCRAQLEIKLATSMTAVDSTAIGAAACGPVARDRLRRAGVGGGTMPCGG
jgi:hypothetical protein